ncbi:MAG: hypothetical protein ACRC6V_01460 [Bacteroidales bacterium]
MSSNWREWKVWHWVGLASFGILLVFLYFTNKTAFSEMTKKMKDFQKKEDEVGNKQKEDAVVKVKDNAECLKEAEARIHATLDKYTSIIEEEKTNGKSVEEKVDDFNAFMGNKS